MVCTNVSQTEIDVHAASLGARQCVSSADASRRCLLGLQICTGECHYSPIKFHGVATEKGVSKR
jgi:hypothetical protein